MTKAERRTYMKRYRKKHNEEIKLSKEKYRKSHMVEISTYRKGYYKLHKK